MRRVAFDAAAPLPLRGWGERFTGARMRGPLTRSGQALAPSPARGEGSAMLLAAFFLLTSLAVRAEEQIHIGVTEPVSDLRLSLPVDGIVDKVAVKEGDWVERDTLILGLDGRLEELEVQRRRLMLEDKSQLQSIRARKATVQSILASTRKLFEKSGAVAEEEVKKLALEFEEASAREHEMEAQEAREKVEYDMALEKRDQRLLRAPIAGVVTEVMTDVGQRAATGEAVARLVDPKRCYLVVNLDETVARSLEAGAAVKVEIQAGEGWVEKAGTLALVLPVADPSSRLVRVKVAFDNMDGRIWPGVAGRIRLAGK